MNDKTWKIEYNNDIETGHDYEKFWQWWEVTDGTRVFKCDREEDAVWLCDLLNQQNQAKAATP